MTGTYNPVRGPDSSTHDERPWTQAGFSIDEAAAWIRVGAADPTSAHEWERYGFTPTMAKPRLKVGEVGPADAITMSAAGMSPRQCARIRSRDRHCVSFTSGAHARANVEIAGGGIDF